MKTEIRLALLCLAATAAPAFAQAPSPQCGATNYDQSRNIFTVMNPAAGAVNQQCFLTVYPVGTMPSQAQQFPGSYLAEGTYVIELSGGGGGGGGGGLGEDSGGGGGAGAAPAKISKYLTPGVYKLTFGTGGLGGSAKGGRTGSGNPTSLTNVTTGQLVAGFAGADVWTQQTVGAEGNGSGGQASAGGSSGGSGAGVGDSKQAAQSGGASQSASGGSSGTAGQAGRDRRIDNDREAGGGGGASIGSGGAGGSASGNAAAGSGDLGGGGGGGRGGEHNAAQAGAQGGHGSIKLTMSEPARQAIAPAPEVIVPRTPVTATPAVMTEPAPVAIRPARKDRN